ncbi:MAG: hypothetical protein K8R16_03970 [Anaerolineales bacterium]|nr:hypothetical protein [Anaerolineales bacterium]
MTFQKDHAGCQDLLDVVKRIKPAIHIFGHIHEDYGINAIDGTTFINASSCDQLYQPVNPPLIH